MIILKIKDPTRRAAYIKDFSIQKYFSVPIENYLEVHTFRKGEFICEERKAPQRLYFIKEGDRIVLKQDNVGRDEGLLPVRPVYVKRAAKE